MKKIILLMLCAAVFAVSGSGCVSVNVDLSADSLMGRGDLVAYTFDIDDFTEIRIEILCNIEYFAKPSDTVTLEIQSNLIDYISITETDGVLVVRATRGISFPTGRSPILTVGSSMLDKVTLAGVGNFTAHDTINGDSFTINMAGAGRGEADVNVKNLYVSMSGAGDFSLSGTADIAELVLGGAGNIEAMSLQTRRADVILAGVGSVRLSCSENLRVSAGGVGSVEYKGSPNLDVSRGGLVSVRQVTE